jgi:hypothetical protein
MTRLIHTPDEPRRVDIIYAIIGEVDFAGLVAGEEVRPKSSDGTPIVLRSTVSLPRMLEILIRLLPP